MIMNGFNLDQRCLMNVCGAVADEIRNGYPRHPIGRYSWSYLNRSVLKTTCHYPQFCYYEPGILVLADLIDLGRYDDEIDSRNDWRSRVVTQVDIVFRQKKVVSETDEETPLFRDRWDDVLLKVLFQHRGWDYPAIMSLDDLYEKYPESDGAYRIFNDKNKKEEAIGYMFKGCETE